MPGQIPLPELVRHRVSGTATSRAEVHVRQPLVRDPVQQLTLSTHRPDPGGTRVEGSGLEEFSAGTPICWASMCIS